MRSRAFAGALVDSFRLMLPDIEFFLSRDIESGARWNDELTSQLAQTNYGILCLTPDNLDSRWMLFEAGALSKEAGSRVCAVLFDGLTPANVRQPLAQFQNREFNESAMLALFTHLCEHVSGRPPTDPERVFRKYWSDIKEAADAVSAVGAGTVDERPERELLEEVLDGVRKLLEGAKSDLNGLALEGLAITAEPDSTWDRVFATLSGRARTLLAAGKLSFDEHGTAIVTLPNKLHFERASAFLPDVAPYFEQRGRMLRFDYADSLR